MPPFRTCGACADGQGTLASNLSPRQYGLGLARSVPKQRSSPQARPGKRFLRKLQRSVAALSRLQACVAGQRRSCSTARCLSPTRNADPDQTLAAPFQHCQAAQRLGLPATGGRKHDAQRPETDHSFTLKRDLPMGALHSLGRYRKFQNPTYTQPLETKSGVRDRIDARLA